MHNIIVTAVTITISIATSNTPHTPAIMAAVRMFSPMGKGEISICMCYCMSHVVITLAVLIDTELRSWCIVKWVFIINLLWLICAGIGPLLSGPYAYYFL